MRTFAMAVLSAVLLAAPKLAAAEKVNVVVILADDLGWADLGCYGSKYHKTPNLDRLAAAGMRFTDGYAACPVCSPTRTSGESFASRSQNSTTSAWREVALYSVFSATVNNGSAGLSAASRVINSNGQITRLRQPFRPPPGLRRRPPYPSPARRASHFLDQ